MGGSASKKRSSRSERCCSSRHGYSQECFDYVFDYLPPRCSYLNEPTANSQPLPSAPVLPYVYDDEEEKQIDMPIAISAYPEVPNYPRESASTLSMNPSYACDVDEEDRQIDMAIWASLKAPNSTRESFTSSMNPNYGQECSSRFEIGSSSSSSSSSSQPRENPNHFSGELGGCGICFEVISTPAICDPCGHVSCYECLLRIQGNIDRCPRCRGAITKVMRIYM
ncbi:hypothetical protein ACLB2K_064581 [Fragaria x ananassa]